MSRRSLLANLCMNHFNYVFYSLEQPCKNDKDDVHLRFLDQTIMTVNLQQKIENFSFPCIKRISKLTEH